MSEGDFPQRAFLQTFEGNTPPDMKGLEEELKRRKIHIIYVSVETLLNNPPKITKNDLIVGDFSCTRASLSLLGVSPPPPPDYPPCLSSFLHRKIWESTLGEERERVAEKAPDSAEQIFIKPAADTKAFSAIIEPKDQMISCLIDGIPGVLEGLSPSLPVFCAEVVDIVSEYRAYCVQDEIRCISHYLGDKELKLNMDTVNKAIKLFAESEEGKKLGGYGADFGIIRQKKDKNDQNNTNNEYVTCLIEVNEGFSLGVYEGLAGKDHADMLIARWEELMKE